MENTYKITTLMLVIAVAAVVAWFGIFKSEENPSDSVELSAPDIGASAAIPVQTAVARRDELVISISTNGRTRAIRQLVLTAQVPGAVENLLVEEGSSVAENDLLLTLDDSEYQLELREAEAQLSNATLEYGEQLGDLRHAIITDDVGESLLDVNTAESLYQEALKNHDSGRIGDQDLQLAERELAAARIFNETNKKTLVALRSGLTNALIGAEKARINMHKTRIKAPFAGFVGNIMVSPGTQVNSGTEYLTLADLDQLLVDIEILESEAAMVTKGRKALAQFTAFPGETFAGTVTSVNPFVDPQKKTRRATVTIHNPDHKLLPGMYAAVMLEAQIYQDCLMVPKEAIVLRDQRPVVFVVRMGADSTLRAIWNYVEIGRQNEKFVEITSSRFNLKPGEQVITSNHYTMIHDAQVRPIEP